jgi:hypothetical protein
MDVYYVPTLFLGLGVLHNIILENKGIDEDDLWR